MDYEKFRELYIFFRYLEIQEEFSEKDNSVYVTYSYNGKKFKVGPLYYHSADVYVPYIQKEIRKDRVLNIEKHLWPDNYDNTENIIEQMSKDVSEEGKEEFKNFLRTLKGKIRESLEEGMDPRWWPYILNNNHWHDVVIFIKACYEDPNRIKEELSKDVSERIKNKYFDRLIYEWSEGKRAAFHGNYEMVKRLLSNVEKYGPKIIWEEGMERIKKLLKVNNQIVLTGPPGTGKTFAAKEIALSMLKEYFNRNDIDRDSKEYTFHVEFVQFHPSYDYTDFMEGLRPVRVQNNPGIQDQNYQIGFELKNGVFKEFCKKAGVIERILFKKNEIISIDALLNKIPYFCNGLLV